MNKKRFRKRALAVAAATVTTASALSLGMGGTTNAGTFPLGDVNLDGKVDLMDAQMALKGALRIDNLDSMQFKAADVNRDNKVDLMDAQMILKGALRIERIEGEISDTTPTTPPTTTEKPETSETPTETTIPTTAPTIEPTEIITTLENGEKVTTTLDEGIEGIDWKWQTYYEDVSYCKSCGKCLGRDSHGYRENLGNGFEKHFCSDPAALEEYLNNTDVVDPDVLDKLIQSIYSAGYFTKTEVITYKIKLK